MFTYCKPIHCLYFHSMLSPTRNRSESHSLSGGFLSPKTPSSRAAGLVEAALKKGKGSLRHTKKNTTATVHRKNLCNPKRSSPYPGTVLNATI